MPARSPNPDRASRTAINVLRVVNALDRVHDDDLVGDHRECEAR